MESCYYALLFAVTGVHADGHRTVVEQFHLHVGAEFACADGLSYCLAQAVAELLVERNGYGVGRGVYPRRAVALLL